MSHDLAPIELEHRAARSFGGIGIVHARHALFYGEDAGAVGHGVGFAFVCCFSAEGQGHFAEGNVEPVCLWCRFGDGANCSSLNTRTKLWSQGCAEGDW